MTSSEFDTQFGSPVPPVPIGRVERYLHAQENIKREEVVIVEKLLTKICFEGNAQTLHYGSSLQEKINALTDHMLKLVNNSVIEKIRQQTRTILQSINQIDLQNLDKPNWLENLMGIDPAKQLSKKFDEKYAIINNLIQEICEKQSLLTQDLEVTTKILADIDDYLTEINAHLMAGEIYVAYYKEEILPKREAEAGQDIIRVQKFKSADQMLQQFERRLYDLKLTRLSLLQSLQQWELVRKNYFTVINKIQSTFLITIPMWKKQYLTILILLKNNQLDLLESEVQKVLLTQNEIISDLKEV